MSKDKKSVGRNAAPLAKECEKCVTTLKIAANGNGFVCVVCTFIKVQRAQRKCISCGQNECHIFCDWCGRGFHFECAAMENENVSLEKCDTEALYSDFCCYNCDTDTEEGRKRMELRTDHSNYCGECKKPFNLCVVENDRDAKKRGYHLNQAVLVEANDMLYNSIVTQMDPIRDRVKIHFSRWSKTFDDWYAMDDERINESLACDCCNRWFHIGCLPSIKSTGRSKDALYVCPTCVEYAAEYHRTGIVETMEESMYPRKSICDQQNANSNTQSVESEAEEPNHKVSALERDDAIRTQGNGLERKTKKRKRQLSSKAANNMRDHMTKLNVMQAGQSATSHSLLRLLHTCAQSSTENVIQTEGLPSSDTARSACSNDSEQSVIVIKPEILTVNAQEPLKYGDAYQSLFEEAAFSTVPAAACKVTESVSKPLYDTAFSAFDILREVATQSIRSDNPKVSISYGHSTSLKPERNGSELFPEHQIGESAWNATDKPISAKCDNFNDLHFSIRREMYIQFCSLEKIGLLSTEHAQVLRYLIYPTSERFQDLKFVYLVNKHLPAAQLTTHLLELIQTVTLDQKVSDHKYEKSTEIPSSSQSLSNCTFGKSAKTMKPSIQHDSVHFRW